jgi:hypothetical protein
VAIYDIYLRRPRKPTKWTRIADVPAEIRTEYFHHRSHSSAASANCSVSEIQPGHANTTARVNATRASGDNTDPARHLKHLVGFAVPQSSTGVVSVI